MSQRTRRGRPRPVLLAVGLLAFGLCGSGRGAPSRIHTPRAAIPPEGPVDVDQLISLARVQQSLNARAYFEYNFRQTTRTEVLDSRGEVKSKRTRSYRVLPARDGIIRHLLEVDGDEPSPKLVKKQAARNQALYERWEKLARKRQKVAAKQQRKRQAALERAGKEQGVTPEQKRDSPTAKPVRNAPAAAPPGQVRRSGSAPAAVPRSSGRTPSKVPTPRQTAAQPPKQPLPVRTALTEPPGVPPAPPCDAADPRATVRAPLPGGNLKSRPRQASEANLTLRRARKSTGDYTIFELLSLVEHEYAGTCDLDGRLVHVVGFSPMQTFEAQNPVERVAGAMEGTILIDALEIQVVRTEGRLVAPIKWGPGLVSLREARVVFEAQKINDEVWLPALDQFEFDSRVLLKKDRERTTHYYDDYQKGLVTTSSEVMGVADEAHGGQPPPH